MPSATLYRRLVPGLLLLSLSIAGLPAASIPTIPGVDNFHQVDEHVYRGAQPHDEGYAGLAKLGIKTVLDLRGENGEEKSVQGAGMRYVRLPWSGFKAPDESQIKAVMALLNDQSAWPVFVHCRRGADRTGTAIACYRIEHDHWTGQQALIEAKTFGMSSLEMAMQHFILGFSVPPAANLASSTAVANPAAVPVLQPAP
jgi:protein tyrosine/serine phosphatase